MTDSQLHMQQAMLSVSSEHAHTTALAAICAAHDGLRLAVAAVDAARRATSAYDYLAATTGTETPGRDPMRHCDLELRLRELRYSLTSYDLA
jgi:hypothetical protein